MEQHLEKLTHTSALQLYRLPRSSQLPGTLALTGMNLTTEIYPWWSHKIAPSVEGANSTPLSWRLSHGGFPPMDPKST